LNLNFKTKNMKKTLQTIKKAGIYSAFFGIGIMSAQTTYTFTNASAIGKIGPTAPQISAAYLSTNLNGSVTVTGGIQSFTVPTTGPYRVEAYGASGGTVSISGYGAKISGDYNFTAGTVLSILVGQMGSMYATGNSDGGGGGSFVAQGATLFAAAGGGGGAAQNPVFGQNANTSTTVVNGAASQFGSKAAGYNVNGTHFTYGVYTTVAQAFTNGGAGQAGGAAGGWPGGTYGDGGFGGGGSACACSTGGGGGGGGYLGGGGGNSGIYTTGYGGSSYLNPLAVNQNSLVLSTYGNGKVVLTLLYGVNITQTSTIACNGLLTAALSASVSGGTGPYTYSWSPTGGTASTATGLGAGTYTCLVSSAVSGTTSGVFTVTQPSAVVSAVASKTNVSCYGGANGVITLTTTGGTAPYSYSWTPTGGSAATASGLVAGTYSCTVKDANLCSVSVSTTITQPATFSVATSNSIICVGSTASLTATGATSYTWNTAATTSVIAVSPTVTTTYTVTGVTGVCSNSLTITQNVSTCTNINEVLGNLVTIYPNPNNGVFTIELNATTQVSITTILGDVLVNTTLNTGKQTLDIQNKANGIYFVKLIQNGKQQTIKLIKE
jgi:hypothetical protein